MSGIEGAPVRISRHPPFLLYWLARVCGSGALQMQAVAVGWQIYDLTGNALDLGLVGLSQFFPAVLFVLVTGHVADRYDRRIVLCVCQIVEGLCAATLAFGTWKGILTREWIFALVFVLGSARAFEMPTLQSLLPALVPAQLLPRAVASAASANQTANIAGPALGGLLYALGPVTAYSVCAILFFSASLSIASIRIARTPPKREPVSVAMLFAGMTFIRKNPVILGAISLDMFAVLLGGATALLPIFARDVFEVGPWGLGFLRAAPGVGALMMAIVLAHWPPRRHVGQKMFAAVATFGVATIVFALSRSFILSFAALMVLGLSDMVSVVVRQTLVQLFTPDQMRGRVNAVNSLFIGTSNQLGEFESGAVAALVGAVGSAVIGGLGTLLVVALWLKLFPDLRRIDSFDTRVAKLG